MGSRSLGHVLLLAVGIGLASPVAGAQTDEERAGARALAEQGAAAFEEGRWKDAVDFFSRAQSVVDAPPHLLYIARAQEKQGNLVQAMEAYIKVTRAELDGDAPEAFVRAKQSAEEELAALTPRIPQVTVTVTGERTDDVVVKVDGEALPSAFVGVKRPANPGKHSYSAEGDSMQAPLVTIAVNEGGEAIVELVLQPKAMVAQPEPATQPQPAVVDAPPATPAEPSGSGLNIPAYAALGVGAIGVGVGTVFLIKRRGSNADADELHEECRSRECGPEEADELRGLEKDGASAGTFSAISYGVGVVGVGVGLYLLITGGDETASGARDNIGVWASNNQVGIAGRF